MTLILSRAFVKYLLMWRTICKYQVDKVINVYTVHLQQLQYCIHTYLKRKHIYIISRLYSPILTNKPPRAQFKSIAMEKILFFFFCHTAHPSLDILRYFSAHVYFQYLEQLLYFLSISYILCFWRCEKEINGTLEPFARHDRSVF